MKACSFLLLLCAFSLPLAAPAARAQENGKPQVCGPDALGTSRTLTLKRQFAGYGKEQYGPLPLEKGEVAITFDDGPNPETVDKVLAALAAQCVKATFFMTGANLEKHPELGRRVAQAGHTPALHSHAHPFLSALPVPEQMADFDKGMKVFANVFGKSPAAYRFPFLEQTPAILAALKAKHMTVASIDLHIHDYGSNDQRPEVLVARLVERLEQHGGGLLLMHDANPPTAEALPALLKAIKDKGYKVVHLRWEEPAAAP